MQLIVDSESTLDIKKDMSAIEDFQTDKVSNGDIEQLIEKNCNGNKENIGEVNVIINDEKNKQIINADIEALPNLPIEIEPENTEKESSIGEALTEKACEAKNSETNGTQQEESQSNGTDKEIQSISLIEKESEEKPEESVQETTVEDKEDIIQIKQNNLDQIPDIAENKLEKVNPETDNTKSNVELPVTEDDVEIIEEPVETQMICETIPDVELEKPVPDVKLEEPASIIENEDKLSKSSDDKEKHLESPENKGKELESSENKEEQLDSSENKDQQLDEIKNEIEVADNDSTEINSSNNARDSPHIELKDDMDMDVEEVVETAKSKEQDTDSHAKEKPSPAPVSSIIDKPILCKLSNTLDILSDDEEELPEKETTKVDLNEKQCINIEDDDDIMVIDEDTSKTETTQPINISNVNDAPINTEDKTDSETGEKTVEETIDLFTKTDEKDSTQPEEIKDNNLQINVSEKQEDKQVEHFSSEVPLLPDNFLKSAKKNLSDMTREDLEEFCILKIVESIVDRSSLSEIKNKLKTMAQGIDEYRKKAMMLSKQNRDLQVVLKSIQEEQKKMSPGTPITPLKITRSVGMQVYMEKSGARRKNLAQLQNSTNTRQTTKSLPVSNLRPQKPPAPTLPIPVPRLVPANSPSMKSPSTIPIVNQITPSKTATPMPNGIKNPSPSQKAAEKRQLNRNMSVTVDLTDDEPPAKVTNVNRTSPAPPVRVVPSQNLMATPRQAFPAAVSSPRKVYIPISAPQTQNMRPGQTIMLKTVPTPGLRPRGPTPQVVRHPPGSVRINRVQTGRHPAPLPDAMKQYQPPNWKALPPAPDLKLSKVENGIVISWKIEGYQEDSYEEIASYQLYAYQETSSPPNTSLWKKIGDVKALPLPMACTLTQFMAGFKYFFAVRAVDIRSRLGPFSLPGSILLLNKL